MKLYRLGKKIGDHNWDHEPGDYILTTRYTLQSYISFGASTTVGEIKDIRDYIIANQLDGTKSMDLHSILRREFECSMSYGTSESPLGVYEKEEVRMRPFKDSPEDVNIHEVI